MEHLEFFTNWWNWLFIFGVTGFIAFIAYLTSKSQEKYSKTLKVGDVVSYRGKPAKILEIKDGKARVETTMPLMLAGDKIDTDEYKFE